MVYHKCLRDDDMRRRQYNDNGRNDGVGGESDEAEAIDDHGGELPVDHHLVELIFAAHLVGDVAQLTQDALELSRVVEAEGGVWGDDRATLLVGPAHESGAAPVVAVGGGACAHRLNLPDVIVDVEDVGQERLGRALLQFQLPHLVVHHDGLAGDLLARPVHAQDPRQPLEQHTPNLPRKTGKHTTIQVRSDYWKTSDERGPIIIYYTNNSKASNFKSSDFKNFLIG